MIQSRFLRAWPSLGLVPLGAVLQASGDDSLTFGEVLSNVPHDAAALVVYTLVGASLTLIWWGHRNANKEHHGYDRLTRLDDEGGGHPRPPARGDRPRRPAA